MAKYRSVKGPLRPNGSIRGPKKRFVKGPLRPGSSIWAVFQEDFNMSLKASIRGLRRILSTWYIALNYPYIALV